jgi:hypothetical protein
MQIVFMSEKVRVLPGPLNCIMGFSNRKPESLFEVKIDIGLTLKPILRLDYVNLLNIP